MIFSVQFSIKEKASIMIHYLTAAWTRPMRLDSDGPNIPMPSATSYGYDIQSRVLGIPDKYGFFSQGPPRLQEVEGTPSAVLILMRIATIDLGGGMDHLHY
ncbi:unnamed protein product [Clonostachys rosea f. rosea IK726]|uniref:Uncharacterized protein n=2 Tax=Bionectria ochroleuca TaxID=29856 RepID=A0A0B7JH98_BIOOC|nr:unnamed protein product [Clonostachys rosea f. rosea IK726]